MSFLNRCKSLLPPPPNKYIIYNITCVFLHRWLCGPDWPNYGEIDIIEGVNVQTSDYTTLHTNQNCSMSQENTKY